MFKRSDWIVSIKVFALHVSQVDDSSKLFIMIFWRSGTKPLKKSSFYGRTGVFFRRIWYSAFAKFPLGLQAYGKNRGWNNFEHSVYLTYVNVGVLPPTEVLHYHFYGTWSFGFPKFPLTKGEERRLVFFIKWKNVLFSSKCNSKTNLSP